MSNKRTAERLVLAFIYLLLISFAATASYFIADLIMRMLNTIMVLEQTHTASIVRLFLTVLISGAILSAVSFWEGYHFASFEKGIIFPAISISLGAHFGLGFLFGFIPWVTGGVMYLAGWMNYGADYTSESSMATKDVSVFYFIGAFLIFAAMYTLFMTVPQYYGMVKRLADREELLAQSEHKITYVQPSEEYATSDENNGENS